MEKVPVILDLEVKKNHYVLLHFGSHPGVYATLHHDDEKKKKVKSITNAPNNKISMKNYIKLINVSIYKAQKNFSFLDGV